MATYDSNIYLMSEALHELAQNFVPEEDEETMALGLYGFFNSVSSLQLSNSIRIAQENANEMLYNRARLSKNIIAYAFMNGITDIYATPATIPVLLWFKQEDVDMLIREHGGSYMVIDRFEPITIGDFEYHLDYNIQISKREIVDQEVYVAKYDMTVKNDISSISSPYLDAPYLIKRGDCNFLCISTILRQECIEKHTKQLLSNNAIDNKSYTFDFTDQLVDFTVTVTEGDDVIRLKPIFQGADTNNEINYCNYSFVDDDTIRVSFDQESYTPGINATIETVVITTKGEEGNFTFTEEVGHTLIDTDNFAYFSTAIYIDVQGRSEGGVNSKTIKELKRLIPQNALSRGSLINNTDLNNFFNTYNTDSSRLKFLPSVHNQFMRTYYAYLLQKDSDNNVVPTNTIDISIPVSTMEDTSDTNIKKSYTMNGNNIDYTMYTFGTECSIGYEHQILCDADGNPTIVNVPIEWDDDGNVTATKQEYKYYNRAEFISGSGTDLSNRADLVTNALIKYFPDVDWKSTSVEKLKLQKLTLKEYYDTYGFLYTFPYKTVVNSEGPTVSHYETVMDEMYKVSYEQGNNASPVENITTYATWERSYKDSNPLVPTSDRYTLTVKATQNVTQNYNLIIPIKSKSVSSALYSMMEQSTNNTTVAYYFADISELIIHCLMSDADIVLGTDLNGGGTLLYSSMDTTRLYYLVASTAQSVATTKYTDYKESYDAYEAITVDDASDNIYKKLVDFNGKSLYRKTSVTEDFSNRKVYVESHYNGALLDTVTTTYDSLIDALHTSAETYAVTVPVKRYVITEYDVQDTEFAHGNVLYDSDIDSTNSNLVFLQMKNNERTMNVRCNIATVANKIAKIPDERDEDNTPIYEYMVFDRFGIIKEGFNTYTDNWEGYTSEQTSISTLFDEYSDLDYDVADIYTSTNTDKKLAQDYKVLTINTVTGSAESAKYIHTLEAAVKYMVKLHASCLLYYKNREDVDESTFTQYSEDFLYRYEYEEGVTSYARFIITNKAIKSEKGDNRLYTICKSYASETDINDISLESELSIYEKYNVYEFTDTENNCVMSKHGSDTSYTDSGKINIDQRSYLAQYTVGGLSIYTESFLELKDLLEKFANSTFKMNQIIRSEKSVTNTVLYNGLYDKEIYFIEFFDDEGVSNAYAVSSMKKLATTYAKVRNRIKKLITGNIYTSSDDIENYLKAYDMYGNTISFDKVYAGHMMNTDSDMKCYPIYNYAAIQNTADDSVVIYTNVIDAIEYGMSLGSAFNILDFAGNIVIDNLTPEVGTLYIFQSRSEAGHSYKIYTSELDYKTNEQAKELSGSVNKITQSFKLEISTDGTVTTTVLGIKDQSSEKYNTYIDLDTITEEANIGNASSSDSGANEVSLMSIDELGTYSDQQVEAIMAVDSLGTPITSITINDGSKLNTLEDVVSAAVANPDITISAILNGGNSAGPVKKTYVYAGDSNIITIVEGSKSNTSTIIQSDGTSVEISDTSTKINNKNYIIRTACILVLYDEEAAPICYFKGDVVDCDLEAYSYTFQFQLTTDDVMDRHNNILIKPGTVNTNTACYYPTTAKTISRYINRNVSAKLFMLAKFADEDGSNLQSYGTLGLQSIVNLKDLGLLGYTVTNIYNIDGGIDTFVNFSDIVSTPIKVIENNGKKYYQIKRLPVIRQSYVDNSEKITEFINTLKSKKKLIDKSTDILDNNYTIDLKFYNTYGPGNIYYTLDSNGENRETLDRVNLTLTYGIKLKKTIDDYTIDYIIKDIKEAIENLDELNEYYLDNLAADIYNTYQNSIYYIEFRGLNNYDSSRRNFFIDSTLSKTNIPEFININLDISKETIRPDINIVQV